MIIIDNPRVTHIVPGHFVVSSNRSVFGTEMNVMARIIAVPVPWLDPRLSFDWMLLGIRNTMLLGPSCKLW
jgi:hypothetical protein